MVLDTTLIIWPFLEYIELSPFQLSEVEVESLETLWLRGGFPRSFLARNTAESLQWRNAYISTFLEPRV